MRARFLALLGCLALCLSPASAQLGMTGIGEGGFGVPSSSGSTFNPADKSAFVVLSGGNLIATDTTSAGAFALVRGTTSYTVGAAHKVVFTMQFNQVDAGGFGWVGGIADATAALSSQLGTSGNSVGYWANEFSQTSGTATFHNNCPGTYPGTPSGVIYRAVNFNTGEVYCSFDCLSWSGATTPDLGGSGEATLAAGSYFVAWSGQNNGGNDQATLNVNPTLTGCTGVSTYTGWN